MLKGPPTLKHLSRMYFELAQAGAACSGEKYSWAYRPKSLEELLALGAEMSRYDPRLTGILVEYFLGHWREISPQRLRSFYPAMSTPQVLAVIAEFTKNASRDPEISYFAEYLQRGIKPVPLQLFYRGIYAPGGKFAERAVEESIAQYKRWGFLARELPTIDVYRKKTVGRMERNSRLNVLRRLFEKRGKIRLGDYLKAVGNSVTRQQGLQDLKAVAKMSGPKRGRGALWSLR